MPYSHRRIITKIVKEKRRQIAINILSLVDTNDVSL